MAPTKTTLETTDVSKLGEAALQAGFQRGRRVRVSIEYVDDSRPVVKARLRDVLAQYPDAPETAGMTEKEIMEYAARVTDEARKVTKPQRQ
ncbi:hypothetical protein FBZ89_1532 [Nitrospirillum amazonense]|uniref:Uncharacterized protein n=1 Tax=Nitrospirillum amazonense TaxID=28077 RepID=A0A560EHC8_9PROT|nr:hypothetical protein [Nitrospirillum amazonense]TWB08783.1 hypothetical protein FBZ89_1532 [Nitrospirillum amazonense]